MATTYTKITSGTPATTSEYNDFGLVAAIGDDNVSTGWSSGNTFGNTLNDFTGYSYPSEVEVRKIEAYFYSWGKTIIVGVAPTWTADRSQFVAVRSIDVSQTSNDDLGVPWSRLTTNTILLPAGVAKGRAVAIWTTDTSGSALGISGASVDRLRLMELTMYSGVEEAPVEPYTKISNGAVFAYSTYTGSSGISVTDDGNFNNYWEGGGANAASRNDFIGRLFTTPIKVRRIKIKFNRWSRYIRIGYATGQPGSASGFTLLREIDTKTQTKDDAGVLWTAQTAPALIQTIDLPDYPASMAIGIYQAETNEAGPLSDQIPTGSNSRVGVYEAQYFYDGGRLPNPKPPANVPVLPFTATPTNWTRTEFKTPGTFNFTPAADTTLVLAVAQGGGAGGQIYYNRSGSRIQLTGNETGGDALIATSKGVALRAKGGKSYTIPDPIVRAQNQAEVDWLHFVDSSGRASSQVGPGTSSSFAGGQSYLNGVRGSGVPIQEQLINSGFVGANNFLTPNVPAITPVMTGYTQGSDGYMSDKEINGEGSISFTFNALAGQTISIGYGRGGSTTYPGPSRIYVNDVLILTDASVYLGSKSVSYTVTEDGPITVKQNYTRNSINNNSYVSLRNIGISPAQYGGHQGGSSGGLGQIYLLPEPLTLTVPVGGKGAKGDHSYITSAQNGTLGSGGAPGGDGGDGAIIIYEFKGAIVNEGFPLPTLANLNVAPEPYGTYRTDYIGDSTNAPDVSTFVHKLRPNTKSVFVLMTGAGGRIGGSANTPVTQASPTVVSIGGKTWTANSGYSGNQYGGRGGGTFETTESVIESATGRTGSNYSYDAPNLSTISGGWGSGSGTKYYNYSGGAGGWGLFAVPESALESRTLNIQVANLAASGQAQAGAVFIYETEMRIPTTVTQVAELVLQKEAIAPTQVTQVSELVLQKEPIAPTRLTQVVMMVLQREPKNVQVAVTESYLDVVTPAERGNTRVSQSLQSVLIESDPIDQYVSQVAAIVLVREIPTLLDRMDFGVMRYPEKYTLYDSDIKTVSGIGGGSLRIQLEGDLPEGSTLIINGEDIQTLTAIVQDGDTIQLRSGVLNYFITRHTVYAYISRGDQIVREIAGWWSILQADLAPRKRATIGVLGKYVGMLLAKTGWSIAKPTWKKDSGKTILSTKQLALKEVGKGVLSPVQTAAKAEALDAVSPKQTPLKTEGSDAVSPKQTPLKTEGSDATSVVQVPKKDAGKAVTFDSAGMKVAKTLSLLSNKQNFIRSRVETVSWLSDFWIAAIKPGFANWKQAQRAGVSPSLPKADVGYRASVSPGASEVKIGVELGTGVAQVGADQKYTNAFAGGTSLVDAVEFKSVPTLAAIFARVAFVYAPTVVFSKMELVEYTTQERDKVTYYSPEWMKVKEPGRATVTPEWHIPPKDFGTVAKAIEPVSAVAAHIHLFGKNDWMGRHAHQTPGRDREFATIQYGVGSGALQQWLHRVNSQMLSPKSTYAAVKRNATLIPVGYRVAKANATLFGMKPMLYQAGKNKISAAKYYMGFTTKAEIDAFIVNFLKPTTKTKLDGWVYRVGVDETLVCEVRGPNMPIAWLMHGG